MSFKRLTCLGFFFILVIQVLMIASIYRLTRDIHGRLDTIEEVFGAANRIRSYIETKKKSIKDSVLDSSYFTLFVSNLFKIDHRLLVAQMEVESDFRINATGRLGELGLLQIRPETFKEYGWGSLDDWQDLFLVSVKHLSRIAALTGGDLEWMLSAYNAGHNLKREESIRRANKYFKKVMRAKDEFERWDRFGSHGIDTGRRSGGCDTCL